jgi:predicted nucleotidyltransferase
MCLEMNLANPRESDLDWGMQLAHEATNRLSRQAQIDAVCVLGSIARGESHSGSDIDLMLIVREPTRPSKLYPKLDGLKAISLSEALGQQGNLCDACARRGQNPF